MVGILVLQIPGRRPPVEDRSHALHEDADDALARLSRTLDVSRGADRRSNHSAL